MITVQPSNTPQPPRRGPQDVIMTWEHI